KKLQELLLQIKIISMENLWLRILPPILNSPNIKLTNWNFLRKAKRRSWQFFQKYIIQKVGRFLWTKRKFLTSKRIISSEQCTFRPEFIRCEWFLNRKSSKKEN